MDDGGFNIRVTAKFFLRYARTFAASLLIMAYQHTAGARKNIAIGEQAQELARSAVSTKENKNAAFNLSKAASG
jgi:hypothetical protein